MFTRPSDFKTRIVVRNGISFQVPINPFSTNRYSVHSAGDGAGWTITETLDVDQPLGLSYRQMNHIAIGVRKRMNKEHVAFADATVGGEHIPGGAAILDIQEATADMTKGMSDGTYTGGGLVWCYSTGSKYGVLWVCATGDGTYGAVGDPTILKLHPDKQWGGGDITWSGAHEFDASVDFTGPVAINKDLTVDGTAVFTGVFLDGTTTFNAVAGESGPTMKIFGDWSSRNTATAYLARTDGLVHAISIVNTSMELDSDENNPPTTMRGYQSAIGALKQTSITCAVKGGHYWEVSGADVVYFLPFGDNT